MKIRTSHVAACLCGLIVGLVGPAAARQVVDFARNAGRVDGFSAVRAGEADRARKIVATDRSGHLPDDIITKAQDSDLVDGFGAAAFVKGCADGALRGHAHVVPTIGPTFERVPGFSTTYGGPADIDRSNCHHGEATARHVAPGVFDVRLALIVGGCDAVRADVATALVTVQNAEPLIPSYEPHCEDNNIYVRVHISDLNGAATDAPFTIALLDENGIPIP